ncbi:MAG: hypothetical protein MUF61_03440 [archaeon]|nr:hypothetical protein [archaeon]
MVESEKCYDCVPFIPGWVADLMIEDRARMGGPQLRGRDNKPLDDSYPVYTRLDIFTRAKPVEPASRHPRVVYSSRDGVLQPVYDEKGRMIAKPSRH